MPFAVVHRVLVKVAVVFVVAAALVGCGGVRDQLGLTKKPPDEFTVVSKPPLVIPPNFNLRPPLTGTTATGEPQPHRYRAGRPARQPERRHASQ